MRLYSCLVAMLIAAGASPAETIRLPVTQDNSIVMVDGEWEENAGTQGRIRIKGNQHIVAMAFDMRELAGKRVEKATLVCVQGNQESPGDTFGSFLCLRCFDQWRTTGATQHSACRAGRAADDLDSRSTGRQFGA